MVGGCPAGQARSAGCTEEGLDHDDTTCVGGCAAGMYAVDVEGERVYQCRPLSSPTCTADDVIEVDRTVCNACPAGYFQDSTGEEHCEVCFAGKYAAEPGSSKCSSCQAGRYGYGADKTTEGHCHGCESGRCRWTMHWNSMRCRTLACTTTHYLALPCAAMQHTR
jgi:hypothetical protein